MFNKNTRQHCFTKVSLGKIDDAEYVLQLPHRRGLVLSGGGAKCIAYAGMLHAMEEDGHLQRITHVAGTSAGAFIGSFIAFGVSVSDLEKLIIRTNHHLLRYERSVFYLVSGARTRAYFEIIFQMQLKLLLPAKEQILEEQHPIWNELNDKIAYFEQCLLSYSFSIISNYDDFLDFGRDEYQIIDMIFEQYDASKWITFNDLMHLKQLLPKDQQYKIKDLNVTNANYTHKTTKVCSVRETPKDSVSEAVQISGAHPFLYTPTTKGDCSYTDGGMFDNMPVNLLYQIGENFTKEDILCVRADTAEDIQQRHQYSKLSAPHKLETFIDHIWDYLTGAESITIRSINEEKKFSFGNMLYLNTLDVGTTSMHTNEQQRQQVLQQSFIQTKEFFDGRKLSFSNPAQPLFYLTISSLMAMRQQQHFPELSSMIEYVIEIKTIQQALIDLLKSGEWHAIDTYLKQLKHYIERIKEAQEDNEHWKHLAKADNHDILSMVLEQVNHTSEGRYTEYLEYKQHEQDDIIQYLIWVILRFLQIRFGISVMDDLYQTPAQERLFVVEQTQNLLAP